MERMQTPLDSYELVKNKALHLLSFRPHSKKELIDKLKLRGASLDFIDDVMDFCEEYGFLNDMAFAKSFANQLVNSKGYGLRRVSLELSQKGIDSSIISIVLEELDIDELSALYTKMKKRLAGNFEQKNINRILRYFGNHGYSSSMIFQCLNQIREEENQFD